MIETRRGSLLSHGGLPVQTKKSQKVLYRIGEEESNSTWMLGRLLAMQGLLQRCIWSRGRDVCKRTPHLVFASELCYALRVSSVGGLLHVLRPETPPLRAFLRMNCTGSPMIEHAAVSSRGIKDEKTFLKEIEIIGTKVGAVPGDALERIPDTAFETEKASREQGKIMGVPAGRARRRIAVPVVRYVGANAAKDVSSARLSLVSRFRAVRSGFHSLWLTQACLFRSVRKQSSPRSWNPICERPENDPG